MRPDPYLKTPYKCLPCDVEITVGGCLTRYKMANGGDMTHGIKTKYPYCADCKVACAAAYLNIKTEDKTVSTTIEERVCIRCSKKESESKSGWNNGRKMCASCGGAVNRYEKQDKPDPKASNYSTGEPRPKKAAEVLPSGVVVPSKEVVEELPPVSEADITPTPKCPAEADIFPLIQINLTEYPEILEALHAEAKINFRTPELHIMSLLDDRYNAVDEGGE